MNILVKALRIIWFQHKKIILCCVLVGAIALPGLTMLVGPASGISSLEKRQLSSFPNRPSNLEEYKNYTSKISKYFRDHFGFRDRLQYLYFRMKVLFLGVSSTPKVMVGKNGWYYYTGQNVIKHTRNMMPYKKVELDNIAYTLQWRKEWLSKLNIKYVWMFPPNKHTIYPEYLPDYVTKIGKTSRLDQLKEHFSESTTVSIVDFRNVILSHKKVYPTFDKLDTHWNLYGGYIAYNYLMDFLHKWMPDIDTVKISKSDFYVRSSKAQDLAMLMGINNDLVLTTVSTKERYPKCGKKHKVWDDPLWGTFGNNQPFYYTCNKKKYTVLIFHDSFLMTLVPYIGDTFHKTIFVRARPNILMFKWFVNKYKPDIVIEELGERGYPLNNDDLWIIKEVSGQADVIEIDKNKNQRIYTNKGAPPLCSIDKINYVSSVLSQHKNITNRNVPLRLSGWVVDHIKKQSPDKVLLDLLSIDGGKNYQSNLRVDLERPDVAKHFANDKYLKSGYSAKLNVRGVLPGKYKLRIRIPRRGGYTACNTHKTVSIIQDNNAMRSIALNDSYKKGYLDKLYRLADTKSCNIDMINKSSAKELSIVDSRVHEALAVTGWALDYKRYSQPVSDIIMELKNTNNNKTLIYKTTVRIDRPDISGQFELPSHLASGFIFNIDTKSISGGDYSIRFILPRDIYKSVCATKYRIRVVNRAKHEHLQR